MTPHSPARRLAVLSAAIAIGAAGCASSKDQFGDGSPVPSIDDGPEPTITADTHFAAGQLAEARGDRAKAAGQYQAALALDADHAPSLYALASMLSGAGQADDAIPVWRRYAKASGDSAAACANLGYALELAGRPGEAEQAYRRGVSADGRDEACRVNFGLMLARLGREREAAEQLRAVLPEASVRYNLASVYELGGDPARARAEYARALELDPRYRDAAKRLAALDAASAGSATAAVDDRPAVR